METIAAGLEPAPAASCRLIEPEDGESPPLLEIDVDERQTGRAALEICRALRAGRPPVYVGHGRLAEGTLVIHPLCLSGEDWATLGRRLQEELQG